MKDVIESACFGLMTYTEDMTQEEYVEWKRRRKAGYRNIFYNSLTEEEVRQRQLTKTRKLLNDLRQQWFRVKCSGQCMDFNCVRCEELRKPIKQELDAKMQELTNLETPV